jgi:hypothetical protein
MVHIPLRVFLEELPHRERRYTLCISVSCHLEKLELTSYYMISPVEESELMCWSLMVV